MKKETDIFAGVSNHTGMLKFVLLFVVLVWLLTYVYDSFLLQSSLFERYQDWNVAVIKSLLDWSGERIELGRISGGAMAELRSHDGVSVQFNRDTDGLTVMSVMFAAILAWPSSFLRKLLAIVASGLLVCVANTLRLALMLKVAVYWPLQMNLLHHWVLPGLFALLVLVIFLVWMRLSGGHPFDDQKL